MSTEEINDDDLFEGAVDDQPQEEPVVASEPVEHDDQPDDATTEEADPEAVTTADDKARTVPSFRLREEADKNRRLEAELADLRAERAQWRVSQPKPQQEQKTDTAKTERPDPLLDPEGYATAVREEIRAEIIAERRETSLQQAHSKYKGDFEEAYAAAQKHVDPALKARMQQSRDPGETLMQWHREQKTMLEVGNDPNAWLEKKLEERLADPAFLAKAVELSRGGETPQPTQNGKPRIDLPRSLTSIARQSARAASNPDDVSDDALFESITG